MSKRTLFVTIVDDIDSSPSVKAPKYVIVVENKDNISAVTGIFQLLYIAAISNKYFLFTRQDSRELRH